LEGKGKKKRLILFEFYFKAAAIEKIFFSFKDSFIFGVFGLE